MRIIKCDRCGAEIYQTRGTVGYVALGAQDIQTGDVSDDNPFENWDFCDNCMRAINACIRGVKTMLETDEMVLMQEEKFEEILDSVDAGKKKPLPNEQKTLSNEQKPQKKKPFPGSGPVFDVKKAQALRDAGWPLTKIAKEVGVSDVTVGKWTHAPEPKQAKPHEWAEHEPVLGKTTVPRKEAADGKEG